MPRIGESGSHPRIEPTGEPARGDASEAARPASEATPSRAGSSGATRMDVLSRITAGAAPSGAASTAAVKDNLPVVFQESLRASLAKAAAHGKVVGDDDVSLSRADEKKLDPFLRRVCEDLRARDGGGVPREALVAEATRRARIAAQRAAGAAGTADGGRLSAEERAGVSDPDLRRHLEAATVLALTPEASARRAQGPARPSHGAGGPTGRLEETFTDARGRSGRVAMDVPKDIGEGAPKGLLLYFHADGDEGNYASYVDRLKDTAAAHDLVVVSVQEPDEGAWWAPKTAENAAYVKDLLERRLLSQYDLDESRVFFAGESGGASFAGGLPAHLGFKYGGGLILASGGDVPRANGGNPDTDAAPPPLARHPRVPARAQADMAVVYAVGSEDPEMRNTLASAAYYRGLGFGAVRHSIVPGAGHIEFSAVRAIKDGLDAIEGRR